MIWRRNKWITAKKLNKQIKQIERARKELFINDKKLIKLFAQFLKHVLLDTYKRSISKNPSEEINKINDIKNKLFIDMNEICDRRIKQLNLQKDVFYDQKENDNEKVEYI